MDGAGGVEQEAPAPFVPLSNRGVWVALAAVWAVTIYAVVWAFWNPYAEFLMFGMLASAVVTVPMLRRDYDLVSPWSMLALTVYVGCGIRGAFITGLGPGDPLVDYLFLRNHTPGYFFWPSIAFLAALAITAAAYSWPGKTRRYRYGLLADYEFGKQAEFVAVLCAGAGLVAFHLYVTRTGGYGGLISAKRTTIPGLDLTGYEGAHGVLRSVNQLSAFAFFLMVAYYAHSGARHGLFSFRGLFLAGLFANAALLPIYASSRNDAAYILLVALVIQLCLNRTPGSLKRLVKTGLLVLGFLTVLTFARSSPGEAFGIGPAFDSLKDALVFNRNFAEIPKTAHILHAVPDSLPYNYGSTVLNYLTGPIPRSLWPDKPLISPGPVIGITIYGNNRSGIPPGSVAESYWAFGLPGVIVVAYALGRVMRWSHSWLLGGGRSPAVVVVYATSLFQLGKGAIGGAIGSTLLAVVLAALFAYGVLLLAGQKATTGGQSASGKKSPSRVQSGPSPKS